MRDGAGWSLANPQGKTFFSLGVCCVEQGIPRSTYDPRKPGYAAWRHHHTPGAWADATLRRLRGWGFTTIGGWSDDTTLRASTAMDLCFTRVLHVGSTAGAPWFDQWDPQVVARMEGVARSAVGGARDDPRLLGYYTDNELGWWNAVLVKMTLEQPASSTQRQRVVEFLRRHYAGDWGRLSSDFAPHGAGDFAGLELAGGVHLRPGGGGVPVLRSLLGLIAARYYELVRDLVRRHDRRGLILGDRYQSFYYAEVARAAAPHVDVVSTNLNAPWNDGTFPRFFLDTLHALTGKPILVGEIYAAAAENQSGNRNLSGLFPKTQTQAERASAAARTLRELRRLEYVIGADWFQYFDEPPFGRFDGEDYNFGLVDIEDRPYDALVSALAACDWQARSAGASPRLDARQGIPPAPAAPLAAFEPLTALRRWDRERGFVPAATSAPTADLYAAWDAGALHVGIIAMDVAEDALYAGGKVPDEDRMQWSVEVNGAVAVRVLLGASREPTRLEGAGELACVPDNGRGVWTLAAVSVPAAALGTTAIAAGDSFALRASLVTWGRAHRVEWRETLSTAP